MSTPPDLESEIIWFDGRPLPECLRPIIDEYPIEDLIGRVTTQCLTAVFTSQAHDQEFVEHLRASVSQNAYALRDVIAGRIGLDEVDLDKVLHLAKLEAQLRIPQKSIQRSYRVSFFIQWEMWIDHLRANLGREGLADCDPVDLLSHLTRVILTYQDHVASQVAETYTRDYEELNRSRAHVRKNLIRDILRAEDGALTSANLAILAYPLNGNHVAVLLPNMPEGAATQLADGLRVATKAHQALIYPLTLASSAVWLCRLDPWHPAGIDTLAKILRETGPVASVGNPGHGPEGFRNSLHQAQEAERVREAWGPRNAPQVIKYADTGLEILLLHNTELAEAFVESELAALAAPTAEAERLRETLEASFECGSHVAAAEQLQLHEHTVRNRLRKAEDLLGHPLQERRTELQVAIRLARLLGSHAEP